MSKKLKFAIIFAEILFFSVITILISVFIKTHSRRYFETTAESALTKVLEINELHTLEYRYNSYAIVYVTKYDMETYDLFKPVIESVSQDYAAERRFSGLSYEKFREKELQTLPPDSLVADFYNLCTTKEEFDDLREFLSQSRKNAIKMITTKKYAVAYEGIITAGINKPITFSIDRVHHFVSVIVPRAEIIDTNINIPADTENKSVIYSEKRYVNSDRWNKEALSACRSDLHKKLLNDMEFLNLATENARDAIIALLRPFENQSDYKFKVTIVN